MGSNMRYELNGERYVVQYAGDIWELEKDKYNWHLIRHGVTISLLKLAQETLFEFEARLAKMDAELLLNDANS